MIMIPFPHVQNKIVTQNRQRVRPTRNSKCWWWTGWRSSSACLRTSHSQRAAAAAFRTRSVTVCFTVWQQHVKKPSVRSPTRKEGRFSIVWSRTPLLRFSILLFNLYVLFYFLFVLYYWIKNNNFISVSKYFIVFLNSGAFLSEEELSSCIGSVQIITYEWKSWTDWKDFEWSNRKRHKRGAYSFLCMNQII